MRCPTCRKEFHAQPDGLESYFFEKPISPRVNAFSFSVQLCPACHNAIVIYREGFANDKFDSPHIREVATEEIVHPHQRSSSLPDEVPEAYALDLQEASVALEYSPKASAALARRLLQKTLREELGIKKKDLSLEIDEFIERSSAPTYLRDAVDAIRSVGNFAAHPLKNTNTGEIVEVEEGEAEWLVEVLESLFDFVFVQPKRLQARRDTLNDKLRSMGKPELKGTDA